MRKLFSHEKSNVYALARSWSSWVERARFVLHSFLTMLDKRENGSKEMVEKRKMVREKSIGQEKKLGGTQKILLPLN